LKYRISESKAHAVEEFVRPYLHLDHYCKSQASGSYPIATLYLDSDDFKLCRQTLEGQKNRFKLRVRSYTDDVSYPRFFEIKRRMNSIIIKSRARVMDENMVGILRGQPIVSTGYDGDEATLKQFQFYSRSVNARHVLRVRYVRRAYECDTKNRIRVTFDRELAYNIGNDPVVLLGGSGWRRHGLDKVILEIKFTSRYPAWLSRMVTYFDLGLQSVSKYVSSVKDSCSTGYCAPRISG
jgi:SPX domain protein involved in polyphosphate accumulation